MSGGSIIIDRRKNPKAKSLSNRQRFVQRAKAAIRESAKKALGDRSISDTGDAVVSVPTEGLDEPHFRTEPTIGEYDYVLPGNEQFIPGDRIQKPEDENGEGRGKGGSGEGDGGEDDFSFALTHDEFLDVIFDDLELPDLIKQSEKNAVAFVNRRAGHTNAGIPSNLNIERTAVAGISRRIALRAPKMARIRELEAEVEQVKEDMALEAKREEWDRVGALELRLADLNDEITTMRARAMAISYLDDVDLRYNNFVKQPRPITQAVMFCVMDVSYSMGEREKIIAKKFFVLLHLFLKRRYKHLDVVFVRHHDRANECDEETFFTSREGGGTVVSSGYEMVRSIIKSRYPVEDWNIYMAQASDGDNFDHDNPNVTRLLDELLPDMQHFTYIEIAHPYYYRGYGRGQNSNLWNTIEDLEAKHPNMSMGDIEDEKQVITVFRNLFKKERAA